MKVSTHVVLINPDGLVLGVSRKNNHNDFGIIGGKQDPEDCGDPMVTAIRECKEETGLDVSNLRLIFAIHKDGYMGYTYLADYTGEINHNEPHVVKWLSFEFLVAGSFGKYNELVSESLTDMGVKYVYYSDLTPIINEVKSLVDSTPYNGVQYKFESLEREHSYNSLDYLSINLKGDDYDDDDLEESIIPDVNFEKKLAIIGDKYGFRIQFNSDYYSK